MSSRNKPVYRSAFNSDYRNDIQYGKKTRYELHRSTSMVENSDDEKTENKYLTPKFQINPLNEEFSEVTSGVEELEDCNIEKPVIQKPQRYVGFANLPNQIYWKTVQKGFEFSVMVVGTSGLGKSTLINSMFLTNIYDPAVYPGPTFRTRKTLTVDKTTVKLKEGGVNLTLTVVDTPGFGDAIDNSKCWKPIIEYIENRYEDYFTSESRVHRNDIEDRRVNCCLYFIQPTGHGLKELDVKFMKQLSDKVNIIPIIAKADTLTPEECSNFKQKILRSIEKNGINIYKFPNVTEEEEEYEIRETLKERVPFAVVGSNTIIEEKGEKFWGRTYPWGTVNISNLEHCDFMALRRMLISSHMIDLRDSTHNIFYEKYRSRRLSRLINDGKELQLNPFVKLEEEKKNHVLKLKEMESKMEQVLMQKVKQKEKELKDTEKLLKMRFEVSEHTLEDEARDIEKRRKLFELEKQCWEIEVLKSKADIRQGSESINGHSERKRMSFMDIFTK